MNETIRKILEARAEVLAREVNPGDEGAECFDAIRFSVANEHYAFAADVVREVVPIKEISPIPCAPNCVCGMINVRGQILTVVDLGRLFGVRAENHCEAKKVIVLRSGDTGVGVIADSISGIISVKSGKLQASVPTFEGIRQELTCGITADGLVVLDAGKLLAHPALVAEEGGLG